MILNKASSLALVGALALAIVTLPKWGDWFTALAGRNPAKMCSDPAVVDRFASNIQTALGNAQRLIETKANNPNAKPVSVTVKNVIALSYDPNLERAKCRINYHVETSGTMALLQLSDGLLPDRSSVYFVQPDPNGYLTISW